MSIRREPTYLSREVWQACHIIAKSKVPDEKTGITTADQMADELLREHIKAKYPKLFEYQKELQSMEQKMIKELQ